MKHLFTSGKKHTFFNFKSNYKALIYKQGSKAQG